MSLFSSPLASTFLNDVRLRSLVAATATTLSLSAIACSSSNPNVTTLKETGACEGCDLSGADLYGVDLAGANLAGANLSDVAISGADLSGANLIGANLDGISLAGAKLEGADLSGATLVQAYMVDANLKNADLSQANLTRTSLDGADLQGSNLVGITLANTSLKGADLTGATVDGINFDNTTLVGLAQTKFTQPDGTLFDGAEIADTESTSEATSATPVNLTWEDLQTVCDGNPLAEAVPAAQPAIGSAFGFIQVDNVWKLESADLGEAKSFVMGSSAYKPEDVATVVCIVAPPKELLATCEYEVKGQPGKVVVEKRYGRQVEITLRSVTTGEVVDTLAMDEGDGECGAYSFFEEGATEKEVDPLVGMRVQSFEWIEEVIARSES